VVLVPVVLLVGVLGVAFGRVELARAQVADAARAGAEQLAATSVAPGIATQQAAALAAGQLGSACRSDAVGSADGGLEPGGTVRVRVACRVSLADLGLPVVPGDVTVQGSAALPLSPYREGP
jgi:Flp pilus assembly protein TadG